MKKISLIGCSGSIGRQVKDVVRRHPDEYCIVGEVAFSNREALLKDVKEFNLKHYALASEDRDKALSLAKLDEADIIFNSAGGFAGLQYSYTAICAGKNVALANKETLVCGGDVIMPLADRMGVEILPVDSEHSAIWQCLNFDRKKPLKRLIITASGGAFRGVPKDKLKDVTPQQALAHPTWSMGRKITIDSATLMNKGYEIIEAHHLYGTPYQQIEGVIQPQSIVHSLVEFEDGACIAQMSYPTMELPIQLALSYPERLSTALKPMDFKKIFSIDFQPLNREDFPCFDLALKCGEGGGILPCVLNAADEVAVYAFLEGRISFTDIYRVVDGVVQSTPNQKTTTIEQLNEVDNLARESANKIIERI
jgi:1-deoxy-D-xylulose-5-phosphate reductoisomerase